MMVMKIWNVAPREHTKRSHAPLRRFSTFSYTSLTDILTTTTGSEITTTQKLSKPTMNHYRAAVTDYDSDEGKSPTSPTAAGMENDKIFANSSAVPSPSSDVGTATPMKKTKSQQSAEEQNSTSSDASVEDLGANFLNLLHDFDDTDATPFHAIHGSRNADGSVHYSIVFNPNRIQCPVCETWFANNFAYREHRKLACDEPGMGLL